MAYNPERMKLDLLRARIKRALSNHVLRGTSKQSPAMQACSLSKVELETALANQDCNCRICQKDLEGNKWVPDHDHDTLRFRGILCTGCNSWLGANERMVRAVYAYLEGRIA